MYLQIVAIFIIILVLFVLTMSLYCKYTIRPTIITGGIKDDFPYRKYYLPPFSEMYNTLRTANLEWKDENGLPILNRSYPSDYEASDSLSDHFVERERIKCRENNQKSPLVIWNGIKHTAKGLTTHEARELVYSKARGCGIFNAALAVALYKRYGCGKVLDCSAGWGDRLISAYAAGVKEYVGYDTNTNLRSIYLEQKEECRKLGGTTDAVVYLSSFEDAEVEKNHFDIVISSPPFYDQELYLGKDTSTSRYNTFESWIRNFYEPLLEKSINALVKGGHLILYIPPFLEENTNTYLDSKLVFKERLGFRQMINSFGKIRSLLVWQKDT